MPFTHRFKPFCNDSNDNGSVELRIQACLNYDPLREAAMVGRIFT